MKDSWLAAAPAALVAALLALYITALPPAFVSSSGADDAAASYTLGVSAPPGGAVRLLAGKVWTTVFPAGSVAFRYHLFSALCAALAAAGVFALARAMGAGVVFSFVGALAFGFSLPAWNAAVGTGTFEALLLVLALTAFWKWRDAPSPGALAALGLACGLLVAENAKFLPVALLLLAVAAWTTRRRESEGRQGGALTFGVPALAGLLLLAIVPLRAATNPDVSRADAATLAGFAAHVSASRNLASGLALEKHERVSFETYARSRVRGGAAMVGAALGLVGLAGLAWASPAIAAGAVVVIAEDALGGLLLSSARDIPGPDAATMFAACLAVAGMGILFSRIALPLMAYVRPWAFLALALPAALLAVRAPTWGANRENFILYDASLEMLHAVDEGGTLLARDAFHMAPLVYGRAVERRRPDVRLIDREGNHAGRACETLYGTRPLARFPVGQRPDMRRDAEEEVFRRALTAGTPLYATTPRGDYPLSPRFDFAPAGPLYRLVSPDAPHAGLRRTFYRFVFRGEDAGAPLSRETRAAVAMRDIAWGEFFWNAGRWEEGSAMLRAVSRSGVTDPAAHFSVGMLFMRKARPAEAMEAFEEAVRLSPRFAEAWRMLGVARERRNMTDEAIAAFERARDLEPERAEAHAALGEALRRARRHVEALAAYRRALELAPARADYRIHFADLLAGEGYLGEAAQTLEQGTRLPEAPMEVWERLAIVYEAMGRLPHAVEIWREVERRGEMNWVEHARFEQARLRDLMARGGAR